MSGNPRSDLIAGTVFGLLILGAFAWSTQIDLAFSSELESITGPKAYPRIILALMLTFDVMVIAVAAVRLRAGDAGNVPPSAASNPGGRARAALTFAALAIFVLGFERAGYLLTMLPLLVVAARMNGAPWALRTIVVCVVLGLGCLLVFRYALNTVLPEGVLGIDRIL